MKLRRIHNSYCILYSPASPMLFTIVNTCMPMSMIYSKCTLLVKKKFTTSQQPDSSYKKYDEDCSWQCKWLIPSEFNTCTFMSTNQKQCAKQYYILPRPAKPNYSQYFPIFIISTHFTLPWFYIPHYLLPRICIFCHYKRSFLSLTLNYDSKPNATHLYPRSWN